MGRVATYTSKAKSSAAAVHSPSTSHSSYFTTRTTGSTNLCVVECIETMPEGTGPLLPLGRDNRRARAPDAFIYTKQMWLVENQRGVSRTRDESGYLCASCVAHLDRLLTR